MSRIGIVGAEAAKFTRVTEIYARDLIRNVVIHSTGIVSGGCHLGGVDIWAEEEADALRVRKIVHRPVNLDWTSGYKPRNILIARDADIICNIVVETYHLKYTGMRFDYCYHCGTDAHVKSGGCWTARYAQRMGKPAYWFVINEQGWKLAP